MSAFADINATAQQILDKWIASCTRGNKVSRNTIAVGIVVLDHLRQACPVAKVDVISQGGEIKGARSGLGSILLAYGVPAEYLKEATTRQSHQDGQRLFEAFEWGSILCGLPDEERDAILLELAKSLVSRALEWLKQQNLKLAIDRRQAPTAWVRMIVENAKQRSGGIVEQHLVGAKLERRFPEIQVSNHPAHAGDRQTAREGDFTISSIIYHVTANPSRNVIEKCAANIHVGKYPMLLVPEDQVTKAKAIAQDEGVDQAMTVLSIEDFIALNIIEMAIGENKDFFAILQEIVEVYNRRLEEVETDLSLLIEVR